MAANRETPTQANTPAGIGGGAYATDLYDEVVSLNRRAINTMGSIGGTANAITGVCTPVLTADPAHGQTFRLIPTANNTGSVTVNPDARGPFALVDEDGVALGPDDLVAGRPIMFWYDEDDDFMRLCAPPLQVLLDAVAVQVAADTMWEVIGNTLIAGATAQVEHLFAAGTYSLIKIVASGISNTDGSVGLVATLRNASGAIVTVTSATFGSTVFHTFDVDFGIDVVSATKVHWGEIRSRSLDGGVSAIGNGSSATAPDRVRIAMSGGNLDQGRVMTYGLRVPT